MLQTIRNLLSGWVAVAFVILLIIPFAFWGIDSYFGSGANVNAAVVDGEEINLTEYQRTFQNIRQQMQGISPALAEQTEFIKQQALNRLVERILLENVKEDLGLRASDAQVRAAIRGIPAFNNPEGFDTVAYQNFLMSSGYSPQAFEAELREDLALEQLQAGLLQTTFATPAETARMAALENQTRDIDYGRIYFNEIRPDVEVTDEELQAYYDENPGEFMRPERVKVAYLQLSTEAIARNVEVDEEALRAYFENNRASYSVAERRKVRQILVYAEDEAGRQRAGEVAREIHQAVTSGTGFEEAEEQYDSEDITVEVSNFGFLNRGVLDENVDELVFSLEPGVVSEPIETEYGYQIMVVDEVTGGQIAGFEEARGEVESDYRRQQAERQFFELYDELAVLTYEHPDTLEFAAEALDLPVRESGYITRTGAETAVLDNPRVIDAAFSEDVLGAGNNSEIIELDENTVAVLRVIEHEQEQVMPLDEVRDSVREKLRFQKGSARTRELGEAIVEKLRQGASLESLAEEYPVEWRSAEGVKRDSPEIPRQILTAAFEAGRPGAEGYTVAGTPTMEGDYGIAIVRAVHEVDPATLTEAQLQPVSTRIRQAGAEQMWSELMETLRNQAEIEIFEQNL